LNLQTQIPLQPEKYNPIDYDSKIVLLGSCFAEHIGQKLNYFKFQSLQNPFGILFHPLAIENLILNAINKKKYNEADIFFSEERWHSYDAHSRLSNSSKDELLNALNENIKLANKQFNDSSHIIITFGTAWVYRHIPTDSIVANCHKVPQKQFTKELLSVDEVTESLQSIISLFRSVNTKASIIFTVSPVRHLKDGFVENSQSKSHIISAIHHVVEPRNKIHYFPSYEIMMDELRDYRFYEEDMVHPNATAINYIWEKFQGVWISTKTSDVMEEVDSIQKGLLHKPFNPNSEAHKEFLRNLEIKKQEVKAKFPKMEF